MSLSRCLVVVVTATAVIAVFVVNETLLKQVVGVVQSAVVMSLVMLVDLNRPNNINAGAFLLVPCSLQTQQRSASLPNDYDVVY